MNHDVDSEKIDSGKNGIRISVERNSYCENRNDVGGGGRDEYIDAVKERKRMFVKRKRFR
jgi:hypothetical protein